MSQRLLLLDDDEDILNLCAYALKNFDVHTYSRGIDALIAILEGFRERRPFDYLILDCALPHIDGFTLTKIVRLVESTGLTCTRANVAVITAYPETVEHSTLFRESGADKYWRKPADMLELPALLNEWFESEKP